jgi:hypothetical protein
LIRFHLERFELKILNLERRTATYIHDTRLLLQIADDRIERLRDDAVRTSHTPRPALRRRRSESVRTPLTRPSHSTP